MGPGGSLWQPIEIGVTECRPSTGAPDASYELNRCRAASAAGRP
jgi:hypothetical protein